MGAAQGSLVASRVLPCMAICHASDWCWPMPPVAGCADDLISDVIGGCDPLSFGFSAQQELASTDPDSFSNLATGLSGGLTVSTAAAAKGLAADATPKGAPGGAAGCSPRTGSGTLPTLHARRAEQHDGSPDGPAAQLRRFQESYLWSVLSYGANFDVHEVRRSNSAQHALTRGTCLWQGWHAGDVPLPLGRAPTGCPSCLLCLLCRWWTRMRG